MTANHKMRRWLLSRLDLPAGGRLLDAGCGDGRDLLVLVRQAPGATALVGVDRSAETIRAAREQAAGDRRPEFILADVAAGLPFGDRVFDVVYSLNLLECLPDQAAFVRESHRVLKPGGQVVCAHFDWDSQCFDGHDKGLVRRMVHAYADWQQGWMAAVDGWMGRRLWRTFAPDGLFAGGVEAYVLTETDYAPGSYGYEMAQGFAALARCGRIEPAEYDAFAGALRDLAGRNAYHYSITLYLYNGRKV